jgi:2-methylisocitrate lyase-like PEP mutase family enzyme
MIHIEDTVAIEDHHVRATCGHDVGIIPTAHPAPRSAARSANAGTQAFFLTERC